MKHILELDPASSTGYVKCTINDEDLVVINDYGILEVKNDANQEYCTVGETCNALYDKIEALLEPVPDIVYIEDFFVSSRCRSGVSLNYFLRGAICMLLSKRQIKYQFLTPSEWKTFITGSRGGRPTKLMKQVQGKNANKTIVTDKLHERYGIEFPDKILIDGKLRKFKYDISDAIGIAFCGIHRSFPAVTFPKPNSKS